jgi:hypothetical protein
MKFSIITLAAVVSSGAFLGACTGQDTSSSSGSPAQSSVISTPAASTGVSISAATLTECAFGGTTVTTFIDSNKNGKLDSDEQILTTNPVCNGATGAQGIGAGISAKPALAASCAAGGIVVTTFIDSNNNGILDTAETVTSSSTLCNGLAGLSGANGSNGTNGVDGSSAHITTTAATTLQCPAGGAVYKTWTDVTQPVFTVVCNGANGTNGTNGANGTNASVNAGPVGEPVAGKSYSACHHDYLYVAGWLVLRHQGNGSADQGIGSTGFNVWNVDITDFSLASEVGGVSYCQLHWDATQKRLTYTVLDNTDGLAGRTGALNF